MTKQPKQPKWRNSVAQVFLYDGLKEGTIPIEGMPPKEVYNTYCKDATEFEEFTATSEVAKFANRLRYLRAKVKDRNNRAARDFSALEHDQNLFPRPVQDGFGLPFWPDSAAKEKLAEDVDAKRHETMTKEELYESREEYYEFFPFEVFVKHVHQELRSRKFVTYCEEQKKTKRTRLF